MVLQTLLRVNQSNLVLHHVLMSIQGFIYKFPSLLYKGSSDYCAPLCVHVRFYNALGEL